MDGIILGSSHTEAQFQWPWMSRGSYVRLLVEQGYLKDNLLHQILKEILSSEVETHVSAIHESDIQLGLLAKGKGKTAFLFTSSEELTQKDLKSCPIQ